MNPWMWSVILPLIIGIPVFFIWQATLDWSGAIGLSHELKMDLATAEKEWEELSQSGKDPYRVIALSLYTRRERSEFKQAMHLAHSASCQVTKLLKRGRIFTAIFFYYKGKKWRDEAEKQRLFFPEESCPSDVEFLAEPELVKYRVTLQLLGKTEAADRHLKALEEIAHLEKVKKFPSTPENRLIRISIESSLYRLEKDEKIKDGILKLKFDPKGNTNTVKGIAENLGVSVKFLLDCWKVRAQP